MDWLKTPYILDKAYHVFHQYTVRILDKNRDEVQKNLKEKCIASMVYYPVPLHKMKVFQENEMELFRELKNSEVASESILSLLIEPLLEKNKIYLDFIVETITRCGVKK